MRLLLHKVLLVLAICVSPQSSAFQVPHLTQPSSLVQRRVQNGKVVNSKENRIGCALRDFPISTSATRPTLTHLFSNSEDSIVDLELEEEDRYGGMIPQVYPQRWVQLAYLSLLALLSDWICFSLAASPSTFQSVYPGHSAASLIDIFLFTNVASCFLVTDCVAKFGLEKAIKGAAGLMTVGCILRSGLGPLNDIFAGAMGGSAAIGDATEAISSSAPWIAAHTPSYPFILAGTIMVGAAQPFFQCTPPMLSATWFGSDERATSTAVALNFNQIGIATAFLVGGGMASEPEGLSNYFTLISAACAAVTLGTFLQFQNKPPSPPSTSEIEKIISGEEEPPFIDSVKKLFGTPGFTKPFVAFICSISITNIVGAFIDEVLERGGIHAQTSIDLAGAGFEFAILLGGIIIGGYVDKTKKYKSVTLACLATTFFLLLPLGLTDHALGQEPILLVASLLGMGIAAGPIQPINAELAVDVSYPSDETAVESIQQIGGNLFSALLVPIAEIAARQDYQLLPKIKPLASDIRGDVILLMSIAIATMVYFNEFDSPLRRTTADCGDDGSCELPELNAELATNGVGDTTIMSPEVEEALKDLDRL
eukprot:CAMPEP_0195525938 /NCGR_PEP_ID=MMETSP0794_2-20130614/26657_1 /TAXON_ID=515487 /ORGANISM="Stephanopyxis turris, Strain CCMP 815" /LENGTH=594 /DNA_ID=CAMNT_0040656515 /DNA_START=73 /DNA_END=1857 /DNA_ORIENTATION=+